MSIAVIGAAGQLGQDLCAGLGSEAAPLTHADVDITDTKSLRKAIEAVAPRAVINCAAYNHVDQAEVCHAEAFAVNCHAVRELSHLCRELGCTLVHFSTDHVFGDLRDGREPYEEASSPGPINTYGLSKLAGEYAVRAICPRHYVIRTCGLYGLHGSGGKGRNFVDTMLRLGQEEGVVRVVNDQTCTPTYTSDLAAATLQLIHSDSFGLYHWTNAGSCTWYEFACEIFRQGGIDAQCLPISTEEFGARAARPSYSVLASCKIEGIGLGRPRHWKQALQDYLERGGRPSQ